MQILGIILIVVLLVFLVLLLYKEEVPVVGGRDDIFFNVDKYHINQSLLAIPTATPHQKRDILNICKETCYELKQLPGVYQLVKGEVSLSKMKKVAVEDFLGRDTIKVNNTSKAGNGTEFVSVRFGNVLGSKEAWSRCSSARLKKAALSPSHIWISSVTL